MATTHTQGEARKAVRSEALEMARATPYEKWLIAQAKFDLWYGPLPAGKQEPDAEFEWPGYTTAIDILNRGLAEQLPSDLWYDEQSGDVLRAEPTADKCDACHGSGLDDEEEECEECFGVGEFPLDLSNYRHFGDKDVKLAVFGDLVGNGLW